MLKILNENKKLGFTLIELLVVIAVIALLVTIIFVALGEAFKKSRDAVRKRELHEIQLALEMYRYDYGHYPIHYTETGHPVYPCTHPNCSVCTGWCKEDKDPGELSLNKLKEELAPYLPVFPEGYSSEASGCWISYIYTTTVRVSAVPEEWVHNGETYRLGTWLENSNDPDINNPTSQCNWATSDPECDKFHWGCSVNYYIGPPL